MNREVKDHVFEPFFTTKGASGMGLGLAVSYSIIERHGGRIEVESSPGQGTTFSVALTAAPSMVEERHPLGRTSVEDSVRVLVIDDDEGVREALAGMLSHSGHRISQAADGPTALKMMEEADFDLVFTDLSMPGMDGWAVSTEIRRRWPDTRTVLITGYGVSPEAITANRELVNAVLFKPLRFEDITATLDRVLA
jgi:CheY-like chemotaxis protein